MSFPKTFLLLLLSLTAAFGNAVAGNTALVLNSPPGEFIGNEYYYYFTPGDGSFHAGKKYNNGVVVTFAGSGHDFSLEFAAPGGVLLSPGVYDGAVRFGGTNGNAPQMAVGGDGRAHSDIAGSFVIKEAVYDSQGNIVRFHATFSQHDGYPYNPPRPTPDLTGEILFDSSAPLPRDDSMLHPPEEVLYTASGSFIRPSGTVTSGGGGSRALAFDRRGCVYTADVVFEYDPVLGRNKPVGRVIKNDGEAHGQINVVAKVDGEVRSMACDKDGNLFLGTGDTSPRITKVAPTGEATVISTLVVSPDALALDSAGNLYDGENSQGARVVKYTPSGERSFFALGFATITGLTFDPNDNLFVVDAAQKNVTKITPEGAGTIVGSGFTNPQSVAVGRDGTVFVGDWVHYSDDTRTYYGLILKCAADGTAVPFARLEAVPLDMKFAPHPAVVPLNIATRAQVGSGQGVLIAGFIVSGPGPKKVIVRGIGPSLGQFGVANSLADPVLELHDGAGNIIAANDNWQDSSEHMEIAWSGLYPSDKLESAIMATLTEGAYTVVLQGKNLGAGVGVVEVYDMNSTALARLGNISTRSVVGTSENVLIGGFVLGAGEVDAPVVVRAIGPSLAALNVDNPLADPTLELHDKNGILIATNDDWREQQEAELVQRGLAPNNDRESAIFALLSAGNYTAIARGKDGTAGIGVVEVYHLE